MAPLKLAIVSLVFNFSFCDFFPLQNCFFKKSCVRADVSVDAGCGRVYVRKEDFSCCYSMCFILLRSQCYMVLATPSFVVFNATHCMK